MYYSLPVMHDIELYDYPSTIAHLCLKHDLEFITCQVLLPHALRHLGEFILQPVNDPYFLEQVEQQKSPNISFYILVHFVENTNSCIYSCSQ